MFMMSREADSSLFRTCRVASKVMDARLWMSATVALSVVSPRSYASVTTSSCSWVSLTVATTGLRVAAQFEDGAVGVTPGGDVGCASRKGRLRAINSARMASSDVRVAGEQGGTNWKSW